MDEKDFLKRGRKTPFVKWDELGKHCEGVILWTKVVQQYEYGTRNPKLDDDGEQMMQMLTCIETEDGKLIIPVREGSDLHLKLADAVADAEVESVEPGGYLSVTWVDERSSGAVAAKLFKVEYERPPSANGDGSDSEAPF